MIYLGSRYAGQAVQVTTTAPVQQFVLRTGSFRTDPLAQYTTYLWRDGDRIDRVALSTLGSGALWWVIADANPDIIDPMSIPVGTVVRIPK